MESKTADFRKSKQKIHLAVYFLKGRLFCALLFERCADRVCAGRCIAGAYVDLFCRAGGVAVVVNAVGNVANDAAVAMASVLFIFMIYHN